MLHYLQDLAIARSERVGEPSGSMDGPPLSVQDGTTSTKETPFPKEPLRLVLAGYSYGSMQASHLPPPEKVMELFQNIKPDSAESEILTRAASLSSLTFTDCQSPSARFGGFEKEAVQGRIEESRRSLDVRKSIDLVRHKMHSRKRLSLLAETSAGDHPQPNIRISYLLVSPLLPPVSSALTAFSSLSFRGMPKAGGHPTLAVFGSRDSLSPAQKVRAWAKAEAKRDSSFAYQEIEGAGHFWNQAGVLEKMQLAIRKWEAKMECQHD